MSARRAPKPPAREEIALAACVACVVAACLGAKPPDGFQWPKHLFRETRGDPAEAFARQVAIFLLATRFNLKVSRAAAAVGRDRTTASHARDVIRDWAIDDDTDGASVWLEEVGALAERAWALRSAQLQFERDDAPALEDAA